MFQSLFCWKSVWESMRLTSGKTPYAVSILVLLEIGLGERMENCCPDFRASFNPCFVGNRSGSPQVQAAIVADMRFNPCFVGNRSGRRGEIWQANF